MGRSHITVLFVTLLLGIAFLIACSGSSSQTGLVNTAISDPGTCKAPIGPYSAVWVTVTDVQIHNSSSGQWVDLTPGMAPTQVNLLNEPDTECFLAMLGSATELQAGTYEQIRINLADTNDNSIKLQTANQCASAALLNCIVTGTGNTAVLSPLLLSSEDKNGIKIPSGQIAGGNFTIAAGQTKDLDIDFNACASIVVEGTGQYRLKPVLHAGEVSLNSAINGKVVDAGNGNLPIDGGTTVVALEQREGNTDRVLLSTTADVNGNFALCPVPLGTYDLVAVAINKSGVVYATTVLTSIPAGTVVGNVPLYPEKTANTGPATITGSVTTTGSGEDVLVSALEQVGVGNNPPFSVTVPSVSPAAATFTLTTQDSSSCASPLCAFSFGLPGVNPAVGVFGSPISYTQSSGATYQVDALTLPTTTQVCSSAPEVQSNNFTLNPGDSQPGVTLGFSGCTPPPPANQ
jgi:hypothetical protein